MGNIAFEMKRDSASMKTIALLTVVFLPGTFVSGFFGSNLFAVQTTNSGKEIFRRTSIWWCWFIITVPLTIVTLAWYYFWVVQWQKKEGQLGSKNASKEKWYSKSGPNPLPKSTSESSRTHPNALSKPKENHGLWRNILKHRGYGFHGKTPV